MKDTVDPPRLLSSSSSDPALRLALEDARADVPSTSRMDAMAATLVGKLGGPGHGGGGGGAAPAPAATNGLGGTAATSAAVVGGAAVVLVGAWLALRAPAAPTSRVLPATTSITTPPTTPTPTPSATPTPTDDIPTIPVESLPSAPVAHPTAATAPTTAIPSEGESEVHLLQRAQDALAPSPDQALSLCAEHARRFPTGLLVEEREVLAIDALLRLHRRDEAEARAARFAVEHPQSGHRRRIDTLLAR